MASVPVGCLIELSTCNSSAASAPGKKQCTLFRILLLVFWVYSDEVYDLLLSSGPCFSDVFVMTNVTQGEKTERQLNVNRVNCLI